MNGFAATAKDIGARHAGEIEDVFGALSADAKPVGEADRYDVSDLMMSYWSNFARSANPNGPGLAGVAGVRKGPDGDQVMHLGPQSQASADASRPRYVVLDQLAQRARTMPTQ